MSDISGPLQAAVATALRADAGVISAFMPAPVQVFDIVPTNAAEPYLQLPGGPVDAIPAEGFDLSQIDFPVHVWSRPATPSLAEGQSIAAAVRAVLPAITVSAGGRVYAVTPGRTDYLIDPSDGRTVHVVVNCRFTTAPA